MTDNPFKKATKQDARLRMAITGPSGSGKTYTALTLATKLGKVAVLDTERGSAKKYADLFEFDVLEIDTFSPALYIRAIECAVENGYTVLVLDSLSHAWFGTGGVLDIVEAEKKKGQNQNQFAAWAEGTKKQNELVDAILSADIHIIGTMRSKTEYVIGDDKKPRKVGMAPIQRDGFEYEFDIIGAMDMDNDMVIEKTRCPALNGKVIRKPNGDLSKTLQTWLSDGVQSSPASTDNGQEPDADRMPDASSAPETSETPPAEATTPDTPQNGGDDFPTIRKYWPDVADSLLARPVAELADEDVNIGLLLYGPKSVIIKRLGYENAEEVKRKCELTSSKDYAGTLEELLNLVLLKSAVGVDAIPVGS